MSEKEHKDVKNEKLHAPDEHLKNVFSLLNSLIEDSDPEVRVDARKNSENLLMGVLVARQKISEILNSDEHREQIYKTLRERLGK